LKSRLDASINWKKIYGAFEQGPAEKDNMVTPCLPAGRHMATKHNNIVI